MYEHSFIEITENYSTKTKKNNDRFVAQWVGKPHYKNNGYKIHYQKRINLKPYIWLKFGRNCPKRSLLVSSERLICHH